MKKTGIAKVTVTVMVVAIATVFALSCLLPALAQGEQPDLIIIEISAYHYDESCSPWFNVVNEVDVTVENIGDANAEGFYVSLYAKAADEEEYERIGKLFVSSLDSGNSEPLQFEWTPTGEDCFEDCTFTGTSRDYELKAVADCDSNVNESDETNNEFTEDDVTVCYNGYIADERLENAAHGTLHGGLIFTTGDGEYGGLYSAGDTIDTTYEITLPAGASVELARLNVYYTWYKDKDSCPEMEVSIGGTVVPLDMSYNDVKCMCPGAYYAYPWGNYVYDIKDYITGSGTYTVTVKREGSEFCIAAPGIILVYEDRDAPMIEYWINEGADVLMGGRRDEGGFLSLEECKNTATFPEPEEPVDLEVEKATLGVVSAWGDDAPDDVLYFNGEELGEGVYCGYNDPCSEEMEGISMSIGGSCAQVGMAAFDVTYELEDYDNEVIQGDDGDNMVPVNAFLVITYEEDEEPTAVRTLPAEPVSAGENFTIVIEAAQHGYFAQIIETLPEGSVYVDSTLEQESVEVGDNKVKFELGDKHSFNYTVKIKAPESEGTYTFRGILIVGGNEYEVDGDNEIEVTPSPPNITAWNPLDAVVNNTEGESKTFNISVNQIVDISWQINGTEVQTNESITETAAYTYTNTSSVVGIWNVSVIATNTATGLSVLHTWIWNVTSEFTAGISDLNTEIEEGQGQEIITVENITTTPTPATEEKQKTGAEEAPVPGFGLAISLFILIAVAYLIMVRKQGGVE